MIRNYKPDEAIGSKKISMIRKRKMANRDNEYLLDILLSFNTDNIDIFHASALKQPVDVREYSLKNPTFPHQTTGDQFFDEEQFESYRKLGLHIADLAMEDEEVLKKFNLTFRKESKYEVFKETLLKGFNTAIGKIETLLRIIKYAIDVKGIIKSSIKIIKSNLTLITTSYE